MGADFPLAESKNAIESYKAEIERLLGENVHMQASYNATSASLAECEKALSERDDACQQLHQLLEDQKNETLRYQQR